MNVFLKELHVYDFASVLAHFLLHGEVKQFGLIVLISRNLYLPPDGPFKLGPELAPCQFLVVRQECCKITLGLNFHL